MLGEIERSESDAAGRRRAAVHAGRFREDLFFRINVFPIQMPSLRERTQDLTALIAAFNVQLELRGHHPVSFSAAAMEALHRHDWPGNVRELQNLLERLSVVLPGEQICPADLPPRYRSRSVPEVTADHPAVPPAVSVPSGTGAAPGTVPSRIELPSEGLCLKDVLSGIERELVKQALSRSAGVVSQAARLLGLGRTTLLEKIRKLNLTGST